MVKKGGKALKRIKKISTESRSASSYYPEAHLNLRIKDSSRIPKARAYKLFVCYGILENSSFSRNVDFMRTKQREQFFSSTNNGVQSTNSSKPVLSNRNSLADKLYIGRGPKKEEEYERLVVGKIKGKSNNTPKISLAALGQNNNRNNRSNIPELNSKSYDILYELKVRKASLYNKVINNFFSSLIRCVNTHNKNKEEDYELGVTYRKMLADYYNKLREAEGNKDYIAMLPPPLFLFLRFGNFKLDVSKENDGRCIWGYFIGVDNIDFNIDLKKIIGNNNILPNTKQKVSYKDLRKYYTAYIKSANLADDTTTRLLDYFKSNNKIDINFVNNLLKILSGTSVNSGNNNNTKKSIFISMKDMVRESGKITKQDIVHNIVDEYKKIFEELKQNQELIEMQKQNKSVEPIPEFDIKPKLLDIYKLVAENTIHFSNILTKYLETIKGLNDKVQLTLSETRDDKFKFWSYGKKFGDKRSKMTKLEPCNSYKNSSRGQATVLKLMFGGEGRESSIWDAIRFFSFNGIMLLSDEAPSVPPAVGIITTNNSGSNSSGNSQENSSGPPPGRPPPGGPPPGGPPPTTNFVIIPKKKSGKKGDINAETFCNKYKCNPGERVQDCLVRISKNVEEANMPSDDIRKQRCPEENNGNNRNNSKLTKNQITKTFDLYNSYFDELKKSSNKIKNKNFKNNIDKNIQNMKNNVFVLKIDFEKDFNTQKNKNEIKKKLELLLDKFKREISKISNKINSQIKEETSINSKRTLTKYIMSEGAKKRRRNLGRNKNNENNSNSNNNWDPNAYGGGLSYRQIKNQLEKMYDQEPKKAQKEIKKLIKILKNKI